MPWWRADVLVLVAAAAFATRVTPRQEARSVRVTTSYSMSGPWSIDTAAVTEAFVAGLSTDSLFRILSSKTTGSSVPIERAQYTANLQIRGVAQRLLATARVINATGRGEVIESASVGSLDSLAIAIHSLGAQTIRRLAERARDPGGK